MASLFVLSGVPASGKTTWARAAAEGNPDCVVISRDEVRYSLLEEGDDYFDREDEVFRIFVKRIKDSLVQGKIVFADATHLNGKSRYKLVKNVFGNDVNNRDCECSIILFLESPKTCLARNRERGGRERVPEESMKRMIHAFDRDADRSLFDRVFRVSHLGLREMAQES